MSELKRVCTVMPAVDPEAARLAAITENPANGGQGRGVAEGGKLWAAGRTLRVRFLGEVSAATRQRVLSVAQTWSAFANIRLAAAATAVDAEIRVSFNPSQGAWSLVGTDALAVPSNQPTMNLGWINEQTAAQESRRVILHEFGHALGLLHEHQHPKGQIRWRKEAVYQWYWETQRWERWQVDQQVFGRYGSPSLLLSEVDFASIMMYPVLREWTEDGFSVGWNSDLSSTDKALIARLYPFSTNGLAVGGLALVVAAKGLRVRRGAGTDKVQVGLLALGERVSVVGGPQSVGGLTWWQVRRGELVGWCVEALAGTRLLQAV